MEQKKIVMVKTALGADEHEDGRTKGVVQYEAGHEYEVGAPLAKSFLDMKVAKLVGEERSSEDAETPEEAPAEKKATKMKKGGAPENKGA
jgi:hypothetical protein